MIHVDFASLRLIGLTPAITNQLYALSEQFNNPEQLQAGRITEVQRDWMTVHNGCLAGRARVLPRLLQELEADDSQLAVGDWVLMDGGQHEPCIIARMPPLSHLARRNNDGRRQALASNIDTALLVMGLDSDFNLRRIERYLTLTHAAGVAAVVVLTKADLSTSPAARLAEMQQRISSHVPVFAINGQSPDALITLAPWMGTGQTLVLLGSSGAGKSTLTNTLAASQQNTGVVRVSDGRGQHTTTARSLHQCDDGACIIDTPGLRSLQLDIDEHAISASFDDIEELAQQCQFRNCSHQSEPGCAVSRHVDTDRLRNYQKLLREARRNQQTPLDRIADRAKWKVLMRGVKEKNKRKEI